MSKVLINQDTLTNIANAIREKTGENTLIYPRDMAMKISSLVFDDIRLEDIVSYYQEPTQNVANEINALGDEYVSFVAVADTHGSNNKNNSQNIIRYLLKNTKANRLFHLGDISAGNWSEHEYRTWFAPFENCIPKVFVALGNHDLSNTTMEDVSVIYDDLLANKNYLYGNPERFYYYFDDTTRKIRYLVINTSDGNQNQVTNNQIDWIADSVQLPSTEWKLIAFGHMDIMPNDPIMNGWNTHSETPITNALSSTNGTIIGYFCGHEHCDLIQKVNDKFYEIMLLNDNCSKDTTFEEITNPERVAGTISEQALSVISINTTTGDVTIMRIGAGENMSYNYMNDEPTTPTLTSITATYSGGDVLVGTSLNNLTDIVVTATYSDNSTATIIDYTLSGSIVEGTNTITVSYKGKTTTFNVVGYVDETIEPIEPTDAVVSFALNNVTSTTITNNGSGGSQYNATIEVGDGAYSSSEGGLTLTNNAHANVSYLIKKTNPFTIRVKGSVDETSTNAYQMIFANNMDALSIFYSRSAGQNSISVKISNSLEGITTFETIKSSIAGKSIVLNNQYHKVNSIHEYVFVSDITNKLIYLYVDGEKIASQTLSALSNGSYIGIGDLWGGTYNANQITISKFDVWERELTENEITSMYEPNTQISGTTAWFDGVPYDLETGLTEDTYLDRGQVLPDNSTHWALTDYLYCKDVGKIVCNVNYIMNTRYCGWYDQNKEFISVFGSGSGNVDTIVVPSEAYYFRISSNIDNLLKNTITPYTNV